MTSQGPSPTARRRHRIKPMQHDKEPGSVPVRVPNQGVDRGRVIGDGFRATAIWSGRFILIFVALAIVLWLLARVWVGVLPVLIGLILTTVLAPVAGWLRSKGAPPALAAGVTLLGFLVLVLGTLGAIAPSIVRQSSEVVDQASVGIDQLRTWLAGPPVNLDNERIDEAVNEAISWLQGRSGEIASGVFSGVTAVGHVFVTAALVLVLSFFFLKDGTKFLPWLRIAAGRTAGRHLTELLTRNWRTLGGFIRAQAIVSAVDAFFIGLGLVILQVPLAAALAILTFFAGFIPIVGAVTAGALACLVALVSNGWVTALWVLGVVLLVQQLEGHVLQPILQGQAMQMHAGIILLSVAAGSTLFGIPGAFLAVPVAASVVVALRYWSEQVNLRTGDLEPDDVKMATPEGTALVRDLAAARGIAVAREPEPEPKQPALPARIWGWLRGLFRRD